MKHRDSRTLRAIADGLRNPNGAGLTQERLEALAAWLEGLASRLDVTNSVCSNANTQKFLDECQSVLLAAMPEDGMHVTKSAMAFKIRAAFSAGIACAEANTKVQGNTGFSLN